MARNQRSKAVYVSESGEDVTDKAGWMYADLFLALMVIFLATISFVPQLTQLPGSSSGAKIQAIELQKANYSAGLVTEYQVFSLTSIEKDVVGFKKQQGLKPGDEIIFTQIIGGYDKAKEKANVGTVNAIAFSIKMREKGGALFGNSGISISTSDQIPSGSVALRMTFGATLKSIKK